MLCNNCGHELSEYASFCSRCGAQLSAPVQAVKPVEEAPSKGFWFLGFFFPVVGLVLFLSLKSRKPLISKLAGKGALVGAIVSVALYIAFYILYFFFFALIFGLSM